MKNAIAEYVRLSEEEKRNLWQSAYYVFDTNIYFDLYRYSKETRESMLAAMEELSEQLWMPYHVAYEVAKGRFKIITENVKKYREFQDDTAKILEACKHKLRIKEDDVNYINVKEYINKINVCVEKYENDNIINDGTKEDVIFETLLRLYEGKVGEKYSETTLKDKYDEGQIRYDKKIPPGYKDSKKQNVNDTNNMYGDFIIWSQILEYSKDKAADIIFVTNDAKEDWWQIEAGKKIGARPELRREFKEKTGNNFTMYSLEGFLEIQAKSKGAEVNQATVEEVRAVSSEIHGNIKVRKYWRNTRHEYVKKTRDKIIGMDKELHYLFAQMQELKMHQKNYEEFYSQSMKKWDGISQILSREELALEMEMLYKKIQYILMQKKQLEHEAYHRDKRAHVYTEMEKGFLQDDNYEQRNFPESNDIISSNIKQHLY